MNWSDWTVFGKSWREFRCTGLAEPGVQIQVREGDDPNTVRDVLIGDISPTGGDCNCSRAFTFSTVVVQYRFIEGL